MATSLVRTCDLFSRKHWRTVLSLMLNSNYSPLDVKEVSSQMSPLDDLDDLFHHDGEGMAFCMACLIDHFRGSMYQSITFIHTCSSEQMIRKQVRMCNNRCLKFQIILTSDVRIMWQKALDWNHEYNDRALFPPLFVKAAFTILLIFNRKRCEGLDFPVDVLHMIIAMIPRESFDFKS